MGSAKVESVESYTSAINVLLEKAHDVNPDATIEHPLTPADFDGGIENVRFIGGSVEEASSQVHYAAIETAFRNIFYEQLASSSIESASFSQVWNLLDIVSILSDNEQCEPSLVFWLIEELLDSQTIEGCRKVFDYLDSRRERLTAKHFKNKQLIILRACNELLRRLSRAEDTVFCGRVFIFLFQSFPLGDKSSVNLRGEFHVNNITVYDDIAGGDQHAEQMEVDGDPVKAHTAKDETNVIKEMPTPLRKIDVQDTRSESKVPIIHKDVEQAKEAPISINNLYPVFWALQESFSKPTRLFDAVYLKSFKDGLQSTLSTFKYLHQEQNLRSVSKTIDDSARGAKRKRGGRGDGSASDFNPKYLTSRDLFELEISDLSFRRHILVQALILIDFLLSLTTKSKSKLENMSNKSVLYQYTLEEDDAKWAAQMKSDIATYLQQGPEGKFYYRMVDTVLSRDKNWVRWKAESCPPIEKPSVPADQFLAAMTGAQKASANKRLRAVPMGSLDLSFLSDGDNVDGLVQLKHPDRYTVPTAESFREPIREDEFDIEMAKSEEDKQLATEARASKLWRTLRVASKSKLNLFDRIDDGNDLDALFKSNEDGEDRENQGDEEGDESPTLEVSEGAVETVKEESTASALKNSEAIGAMSPAIETSPNS